MDPERVDAQARHQQFGSRVSSVGATGARVSRRVLLGGAAAFALASAGSASLFAAYTHEKGIPVSFPWEGENAMQVNSNGSSVSKRIIFLHQSTGAELIKDGNLRELLRRQAPGLEFWDYGFNAPDPVAILRGIIRRPPLMPGHYYGLGDASGQRHGTSFHVVNTDPAGLAWMFSRPLTDPAANAISHLLQFDVIAFKSCFTIFPIQSEAQLERYTQGYRTVRKAMDRHPDKLFIPLTPPPLRARLCTTEQAVMARQFARWIMSADFHGNRPNISPYDLFDALATPQGEPGANTLRAEYCRPDSGDSHPNAKANKAVASAWAAALVATVTSASRLPQGVVTPTSEK